MPALPAVVALAPAADVAGAEAVVPATALTGDPVELVGLLVVALPAAPAVAAAPAGAFATLGLVMALVEAELPALGPVGG